VDITHKPAWIWQYKIVKDTRINFHKMLPRLFLALSVNMGFPILAKIFASVMALPKSFASSPSPSSSIRHALPPIGAGAGGAGGGAASKFLLRYLRMTPDLPSIMEITKHTIGFFAVYDLLFFFSHWALHSPLLYQRIHKIHHEWQTPIALAAAYAHPVEHVMSNIAPAVVATFLFRPHYLTYITFSTMGLLITLDAHSGYEFLDTCGFHFYHHFRFKDNYSTFGQLDRAFHTRYFPPPHPPPPPPEQQHDDERAQ
jgi:sterol desaturase/sphingolipid hydroxylase (fatty acid hydroxylase superfamily)